MKAWLMSRQPNERIALILGAVVLAALLFYLIVWQPLNNALANKRQNVAEQRSTLRWMEKSSMEVQAYRRLQGNGNTTNNSEALLSVVDQTARSHGLRQQIKRLKPQGEDAVQLWLEQAAFDNIVKWLGDLTEKQSVIVDSISMDKQTASGLVNARITLSRSTS